MIAVEGYNGRQPDEVDASLACPAFDAARVLTSRNYYAMMMLEAGDADGVIAGLRAYYPATIKPALQILKTKPGVKHASGAYLLMFKNRMLVLADTTVNIDPTAEDLADIATLTAETAKRFNLDGLEFDSAQRPGYPHKLLIKKHGGNEFVYLIFYKGDGLDLVSL